MLRARMQEEAKKILARAPHLEEALQQDLDQSSRDSKNWVWLVIDYNRRSWPEASTQTDASVLTYMEMSKAMYVVTKTEKNPKSRQMAVNVWRWLQEARLFHFDPETYVALNHEADVWTTEKLAGLKWRQPEVGREASSEEAEKLREAVRQGSKSVPYPDKMPFPCVFFGYGAGLQVPVDLLTPSMPANVQGRIKSARLLGHLMTSKGAALRFYLVGISVEYGLAFGVLAESVRTFEGWTDSDLNLEPWILPNLVQVINEHRTFVLETQMPSGLRHQYKNERKQMGLKQGQWAYTPPPYYLLKLQTRVIQERVRKGLPHPKGPVAYRTDVRAHERCRIHRGKLPIDPALRDKLVKRGYKVFTTEELDKDTLDRLHERRLGSKQADEWLAVLTSWVESHFTCNDPRLPYIPACRILKNKSGDQSLLAHSDCLGNV